ncbi:MAG: caspase family protein [Saprospiraceae bacterium]|nr:caspase family protein [Saprospiraceae bacterium]
MGVIIRLCLQWVLILWVIDLYAQTKGVSTVGAAATQVTGKTYALVAGISDYQDPTIPDLKFADKDASAFAAYLKSPGGGGLNEDQMKVLLNNQATLGQFASALDWLLEVCKEGDRAIIYFSGHGDVERKTVSQPGFLLCWDAPGRVYMSGGAFGLAYLEEIINTLSTQNKVKVLMVADACHSGKLSGSQIGGTQATAANMARQYANEIKILSCQPTEFSLEGEQWGGGRGVFSYHLVDGLTGLADQNSDASISLLEITRYLEDRVIQEVAPQSQNPVILGNKTDKLGIVDQAALAQLKKSKEGQVVAFVKTESRGLEDEILSRVDSMVKLKYLRFKEKLSQKSFFIPKSDCADYYYKALESDTSLGSLHNAMRRNYAAALQDDAQQVLNRFLRSEMMELSLSKRSAIEKYSVYPSYLERAGELLGQDHYMFPILAARKHFFEAYLLHLNNKNKNEEIGRQVLQKLEQASRYQADMPHIYWAMNFAYGFNLARIDSAEIFTEKAIALNPSWQLPYANLVFMFADRLGKMDKAKEYLDKLNAIDSNSLVALYSNAIYYDVLKKPKIAESYLFRVLEMDSSHLSAHNLLGNFYLNNNQMELAKKHYSKAISIDPEYPMAHSNLGYVHYVLGDKKLAESEFKTAYSLDPYGPFFNYNLACFYAGEENKEKAFDYLESAIINGWNDYKYLQIDEILDLLRKDAERWSDLMKKYFPDLHK